MSQENIILFENRAEWRNWLTKNHATSREVWFVFPHKSTGNVPVNYNDAVEEALCFGWIDSTAKTHDVQHKKQRFTPRRPKSSYSQTNIERLRWLLAQNMVHPDFVAEAKRVTGIPFVFPEDILALLKKNKTTWEHYRAFPESYKRIRIAWIDSARERPEEFQKRLANFLLKTRENKMIAGYGGASKHYTLRLPFVR